MKTIVDLVTSLKTYFIGKDTTAKQAVEANIAPVETDATASVGSYAIGDQLFLLDVLYDVTATITAGDALTVGTNIAVADTVSEQIADAKSDISAANTTIGAHTTAIGNIEASISDTEASTTAAAAYAIGDQFSINGVLYEATAAIAIGDTITVGTNAKIADTLVDQIGAVNSALTPLTATLAINATSVTFSDARITTSSVIDPYTDTWGLNPTDITVTTGQCVLTFEAQDSAHTVGICVR